jgi:basic membrane lipoprotein Med (substrate-binding protein (PBP1-ABC) superfamily)
VWAAAVAGTVLAGLSVWVLWPASEPAPRARQYLASTACLLTDGQGIAGAPSASVWAAMQEASVATGVKVQYLPAIGARSAADAAPYLTSLVQRQCGLIVAVGGPPVAAVEVAATKYPNVRFAAIGGAVSGPNVTVVEQEPAARMHARIGALVRAEVRR